MPTRGPLRAGVELDARDYRVGAATTGLQQDINTIGTIIALLLFFIVIELIIFGHLRRQRPGARQER
jgi:hypothetical protein